MKAVHDITRYTVERDGHEVPCEHPMCWQLHQRFMQRMPHGQTFYDDSAGKHVDRYHMSKRTYWLIIDSETGQRAFDGDTYDTKREAMQYLIWRTDNLLRAALRAQQAN